MWKQHSIIFCNRLYNPISTKESLVPMYMYLTDILYIIERLTSVKIIY